VGYLFRILGTCAGGNVALVFVSHTKLEEVFELSTVSRCPRRGGMQPRTSTSKLSNETSSVTYMIGRAEVIAELPP